MEKQLVGTVAHYYDKIGVAVVELSAPLAVGDRIAVESKRGGVVVEQSVDSMEIEHKQVQSASAGEGVGLKVSERVHDGDKVYKIA